MQKQYNLLKRQLNQLERQKSIYKMLEISDLNIAESIFFSYLI